MGMAASQARFLNLTARKSNIEFHGQQINQQRTELSNSSANLYNQMLVLQVPVPPNTQDYTKVQYAFTIPGTYDTQANVTQFSKNTDGTYSVMFNYTETELGFPACSTKQRTDLTNTSPTDDKRALYTHPGTAIQLRNIGGTSYQYYNDTASPPAWTNATISEISTTPNEPDLSAWHQLGCDPNDVNKHLFKVVAGSTTIYLTPEQKRTIPAGTSATDPGAAKTLQGYMLTGSDVTNNYAGQTVTTYNGKTAKLQYVDSLDPLHKDAYNALSNGGTFQVYVANVGTEASPVYQYYTSNDIINAKDTSTGGDNHVVYYSASDITKYKEDSYDGITISRDGNNRIQSFNYRGEDYAVKANTVTDDEAYNKAMNDYTYQSYLYEQTMNNINAQVSIVHAQDRELELKLKQLDTEHNAIQTEIETVKQISKKNVEDSFKTFA